MTEYQNSPNSPNSPKLQVLIAADCIDESAVSALTPTQRSAIESLTWTEIDNLINARQKTGRQPGLFWI